MASSATIPATVTGQTGNLLDAVDWAADAYTELQNSKETWRWLRSKFSISTIAMKEEYAPEDCFDTRLSATLTRLSRWSVSDPYNSPKCYLASSGVGAQYFLQYISWDAFCALYRIGNITNAAPCHITIDPQNNIILGPTPNDVYTVTGEYQMSPQILANDGDIPEMPKQFHMLIVYEAMRKYAGDQLAQEAMVRATNEGGAMRSHLELNQLPSWRQGRPLA